MKILAERVGRCALSRGAFRCLSLYKRQPAAISPSFANLISPFRLFALDSVISPRTLGIQTLSCLFAPRKGQEHCSAESVHASLEVPCSTSLKLNDGLGNSTLRTASYGGMGQALAGKNCLLNDGASRFPQDDWSDLEARCRRTVSSALKRQHPSLR